MSFAYNNMINVIGDIMAQYKIAVDAGHGGSDYGATYNGRAEKDDNLKLALAVGDILEKNGIDVVYTRTTDEYETPFKKATDANDAKADYFVSIHRNSSPTPNQYTGVETLVYNNSGIKSQMAANINSELEKAGFKNLGITERPNLVVLKRTKMPAVLVEASFINNDKDNETFDKNFNQIANGIADGILKTLGIKPKTNNTTAQAASGEVPSVKSDSAKSAEIMPAACEKSLHLLLNQHVTVMMTSLLSHFIVFRLVPTAIKIMQTACLIPCLLKDSQLLSYMRMTIIKFRLVLSDSFQTPLKWSRSCVNSDTTHILYTHKYTLTVIQQLIPPDCL